MKSEESEGTNTISYLAYDRSQRYDDDDDDDYDDDDDEDWYNQYTKTTEKDRFRD